jgi:hypothetical protein
MAIVDRKRSVHNVAGSCVAGRYVAYTVWLEYDLYLTRTE